ncbi:MAG: M48 family metallopeptidase, partial [Calditrichaeota bacterium]|nr:M48 family metallopeptidase [Calditrichota bacterium]
KDRPEPKHLSNGDSVLYRGKVLKIRTLAVSDTSARVRLREPFFDVHLPKMTDPSLNHILEAWFRRQAKALISLEARRLAREFHIAVGRISIRDQKTRWASCSSRGNLNFNWRLLMAPPEVLRYVIIHELTHREQMNHSRKFWSLVAKRCPDYKNHQKWLKENSAKLREV